MEPRYPRCIVLLLLAAFLLGTPAEAPGGDNAAVLPTDSGGAAALPGAADNTAVPDNAAFIPDQPGGGTDNGTASPETDDFREPSFGEEPAAPARVADPIAPVNRAIFVFNDKAYYWVLKPLAKGYNYIVPEGVRVAVRNFFSNLAMPVRGVNHLLQGEPRATGTELLRFAINSTIGIAGFFDAARERFHIDRKAADLGQTLGKYGLGQGMYLVLPLLGPNTLRDGVGLVGDAFLDPISHIRPPEAAIAVNAYKMVNGLSLRIGVYEDLTGAAVDPYIAVRDAYIQNRADAVKGKSAPLN